MNLSLSDIFRIGRDAVRLFPANAERPCLQLQAFRVLTRGGGAAEIGTDTLGAVPTDKDSPFFWSHKWENARFSPNALTFNYPILTMFEIAGETGSSPFRPPYWRDYAIELAVFDTYRDDCVQGKHSGCEARTVNHIYADTEFLLDSALQYFGQTVVATTDRDETPKVYYGPYLQAEKDAGRIGTFEVRYRLVQHLNEMNKTVRFAPVDRFATQKVFGTRCIINFRTNTCPAAAYNTELEGFGTVAFEAGCKNC